MIIFTKTSVQPIKLFPENFKIKKPSEWKAFEYSGIPLKSVTCANLKTGIINIETGISIVDISQTCVIS